MPKFEIVIQRSNLVSGANELRKGTFEADDEADAREKANASLRTICDETASVIRGTLPADEKRESIIRSLYEAEKMHIISVKPLN